MKILMSNADIYKYTTNLLTNFNSQSNFYLPVLVNFAIQKNLLELTKAGEVIEKVRNDLGHKYGSYKENEEGLSFFYIPEENRKQVSKELQQLLELEQTIDIKKIKLQDLENIQLTTQQMQAILFMIEEE